MKVDLALESAFFLDLFGWSDDIGSLRTPEQKISLVFWSSFWLRLLAPLSDLDPRTRIRRPCVVAWTLWLVTLDSAL